MSDVRFDDTSLFFRAPFFYNILFLVHVYFRFPLFVLFMHTRVEERRFHSHQIIILSIVDIVVLVKPCLLHSNSILRFDKLDQIETDRKQSRQSSDE